MHFWPKRFAVPEPPGSQLQRATDDCFNPQSEKAIEGISYPMGNPPFSYDSDTPLPFPAVQQAKTKTSVNRLPRSHKWKRFKTHWSRFKRHIDAGSSTVLGEESMVESNSDCEDGEDLRQENGQVDLIVVDRTWEDSESCISQLEHDIHAPKSEAEKPPGDGEVDRVLMNEPFTTSDKWRAFDNFRWRAWLGTHKVFFSSFSDERLEYQYSEVRNQ
jgi:hypothetical protein